MSAAKFFEISDAVKDQKITAEDALSQIENINFLEFTLEEIDRIQDCDWITPQKFVSIYRGWIDQHDKVLNSIVTYLLFNTKVTKENSDKFLQAVENPSTQFDAKINNIIHNIATSNGTRPQVNLLECGIFTAISTPSFKDKGVDTLFSGKPNVFFNSSASENSFVQISFPSFIKIKASEYIIGTAEKMFPQTWILEASNDKQNWVTLDSKSSEKSVNKPNEKYAFKIESPLNNFYRHFKITNKGLNSTNNNQLVLSYFDFNGSVYLEKNKL